MKTKSGILALPGSWQRRGESITIKGVDATTPVVAIMKFRPAIKILALLILGLVALTTIFPTAPKTSSRSLMVSYNPAAPNFHAPLSTTSLIAVTNATPNISTIGSQNSNRRGNTGLQTIRQNAIRFINDTSYFPQSETSIAVNPNNPNIILGGYNDGKYFFCPFLPLDCNGSFPASLSGFTLSMDGGRTIAKSSDIPSISLNGVPLVSWGDPSITPTVDGNFFYASIAINPGSPFNGNGVMIAESNSNLYNNTINCTTLRSSPTSNPCWKTQLIFGSVISGYPVLTLEDKDRIAIDRNPTSPYYGSVYIGWDHFTFTGASYASLARCDPDLNNCTILSGGQYGIVSGNDIFVAWTTPVVDKTGNVYLAWCNFGTFSTLGPVQCKISSSPPGGRGFGPPTTILSYMGTGTTLPTDTVIIGWASEQYRTGPGIFSITADQSPKSNNLYYTTQLCTSGHYYAFSSFIAPVADDNPGLCGTSTVFLLKSTDNGQTWTSPLAISHHAVNDQSYVTVDSTTGTVYDLYYTTQYDPFNHLIDVVASVSTNQGRTFRQQRITSVSNEPNADPNMYDYLVPSGFGGSFTSPQLGDYFEAVAKSGTLWVLFTGNYAVEAGTFQTDPYLAIVQDPNRPSLLNDQAA